MEGISIRTLLITVVAPVAWGTTYIVTETFLPPDRPLFAAVARALPAGLVLLALPSRSGRRLPRGGWWWKAGLLGLCNIGLFFPLLFLAAYELPGGLAATVQALSPLAVMAIALPALGERPGARRVVAGLVGIVGVALLVLRAGSAISTPGLVAAVGSVLVSALGFVLVKRWPSPADMLTTVSWQLVAGGLVLVPVALLVEGAPPTLSVANLGGLLWLTTMGTAVAYSCWFHGLARMPAGAVALVGLVNPVVGTVLGVLFAGELFGRVQALGLVLVLGGVVAGQRLGSRRTATSGHKRHSRAAKSRRLGPNATAADPQACAA